MTKTSRECEVKISLLSYLQTDATTPSINIVGQQNVWLVSNFGQLPTTRNNSTCNILEK